MPPEPLTPEERLDAAREEGRRKLAEDAPRAAIYCRISLAIMGDTTKVDEQERLCREVCARRGWAVAEVYKDNNTSAWKRGVKRPGWEAMLAGAAEGRFGAIVTYWGDRIVRQPRDLEDLLDLREGRHISLASVMGQYDFDNKDHRMMMRWEVARACNESDTISDRKKGEYERLRRAGRTRPGGRGGRTFGFATDGITHVPEETAIVREVAARVLAGDGIRTIAASLAACGVTTTAGTPMHPIAIRRMIASPRYAGLMPDGEQAAAWKPVLSRQDWETAKLIIEARSGPLPPGHTERRHLLSGIARCGVCGAGMQALPAYTGRIRSGRCGTSWRTSGSGIGWLRIWLWRLAQCDGQLICWWPQRTGGRTVQVAATYGCIKPGCRKVYRSQALLDAYVSRRTVNRLANPANPAGVPAHPDFGREFQQLATERAAVEAQVRDYKTSPGRVGLLMARLDSIDKRLDELRELASDDTRTRMLAAHAGITAEQFAELPLATRRALVAACYQVVVLPASKRGPGFRAEDVSLVPR